MISGEFIEGVETMDWNCAIYSQSKLYPLQKPASTPQTTPKPLMKECLNRQLSQKQASPPVCFSYFFRVPQMDGLPFSHEVATPIRGSEVFSQERNFPTESRKLSTCESARVTQDIPSLFDVDWPKRSAGLLLALSCGLPKNDSSPGTKGE